MKQSSYFEIVRRFISFFVLTHFSSPTSPTTTAATAVGYDLPMASEDLGVCGRMPKTDGNLRNRMWKPENRKLTVNLVSML
jgi:hypothetical protein